MGCLATIVAKVPGGGGGVITAHFHFTNARLLALEK